MRPSLAPESLSRHGRKLVAPALLAVAVLLGGAGMGPMALTRVLQILAVFVLLAAVFHPALQPLSRSARLWLTLAIGLILAALLQLAPLPAALWTGLPGRGKIIEGFEVFGAALPSMPISMAPEQTMGAILRFLPPIALGVLAMKLSWRALTAFLPWAVLGLASASVALGVMQVFSGRDLYLYEITNHNSAVGLFANVNHQASFLLMSLPFAAVVLARSIRASTMGDAMIGRTILGATLGFFLLFGVLIAGSGAGYLILGPVMLACGLIVFGRAKSAAAAIALPVGIGVGSSLIYVTAASPILVGLGIPLNGNLEGETSRGVMFARTWEALQNHFPVGAGLGSFRGLYQLYEDPTAVTSIYVAQAHNDYLQFAMELGAPGVIILVIALLLYLTQTVQVWRLKDTHDNRLKKAATVSLGVVFLHSTVDYPLRTAAVACLAALCIALISTPTSDRRVRRTKEGGEAEGHITL